MGIPGKEQHIMEWMAAWLYGWEAEFVSLFLMADWHAIWLTGCCGYMA
tara:strand:+ start:711 stop:854 length:144 start_codon:yes stop_codon:yes gene_type:complete